MYTGNHAAPQRRNSVRKPLIILLSVLLIAVLTVGGTLAYLSTETREPVKNTFIPGDAPIEIIEEFDGRVKSSIRIKNTGSVPALIRTAVAINPVNEAGELDLSRENNLSLPLNTTDWTEIESSAGQSFYYCNMIIQPGELTPELLNEELDITGYQVDVLAQSVQAAGIIKGQTAQHAASGKDLQSPFSRLVKEGFFVKIALFSGSQNIRVFGYHGFAGNQTSVLIL